MPHLFIVILLLALLSSPALAQQRIDPSRGVDPRVDYAEMTRLGPWDDRNYQLTTADLALLADNEQELRIPIPVFYRVLLRRTYPDMPRTGEPQYPRSALNYFMQRYGGYLIDGQLYGDVTLTEAGRYEVLEQEGSAPQDLPQLHLAPLLGNVLVNPTGGAAESSVSISPVNPDIVVVGVNGSGQDMYWSNDGGNTWTESTPLFGSTCCDPAMAWSSDGTLAYAVALGGNDVWFYRSDDNGQTWTDLEDDTPGDPRRELAGPSAAALDDKEFIHVDNNPASPFQDRIYITWHQNNVMQFAMSSDNGNTFSTISFGSEPVGIGSDIATDRNGVVYHFWPATGAREIRMNRSTDGGVSFQPSTLVAPTNARFDFPLPSIEVRNAFVYVAADIDNTGGAFDGRIYTAWTDTIAPDNNADPQANHARIVVGVSADGGGTWDTRIPHPTADELDVDRWHPWLRVGPDGTVHVVFYDTRNFPDRSGVDFFYTYSTDGADTFVEPIRITDESSPNASGGFEFGDYNGLDVSSDGGIAIFSDNRGEDGGGPSIDVYVAPAIILPETILIDGFEGI
ncbi:MAG: hypothetical protein Tsb002_13090 [Wenzhouxiangellaceae bacterium]